MRSVAAALAPYGDGRMDGGAGHFYGSFLLELSFDSGFSTVDHQVLSETFLPSPSTLWVLQQSFIAGHNQNDLSDIPPSIGNSTYPVSSMTSGGDALAVQPTECSPNPGGSTLEFPSLAGSSDDFYDFFKSIQPQHEEGSTLQASTSAAVQQLNGEALQFQNDSGVSLASLENVLSAGPETSGEGGIEIPLLEADWPWLFGRS